jgi:hypothetical protein
MRRALTDRQATQCEYATTSRCRCRCGGASHGAARLSWRAALPADDPHYRPDPELPLQVKP